MSSTYCQGHHTVTSVYLETASMLQCEIQVCLQGTQLFLLVPLELQHLIQCLAHNRCSVKTNKEYGQVDACHSNALQELQGAEDCPLGAKIWPRETVGGPTQGLRAQSPLGLTWLATPSNTMTDLEASAHPSVQSTGAPNNPSKGVSD